MPSHLVHSVRFHLNTGSKQQALRTQETISRFAAERLPSILEECLEGLAADDRVLIFDRFDLDIGTLPERELESQLPRRIAKALADAIFSARHVAARDLGERAGGAPFIEMSIAQRRRESLLRFLDHGVFAAPEEPAEPATPDAIIETLLDDAQALAELLAGWWRHRPQLHRRLATQVSEATLLRLIKALSPSAGPSFGIFIEALKRVASASWSSLGTDPSEVPFWELVIGAVLRNQDEKRSLPILVSHVLQAVAEASSGLDLEDLKLAVSVELVRAQVATSTAAVSPTFVEEPIVPVCETATIGKAAAQQQRTAVFDAALIASESAQVSPLQVSPLKEGRSLQGRQPLLHPAPIAPADPLRQLETASDRRSVIERLAEHGSKADLRQSLGELVPSYAGFVETVLLAMAAIEESDDLALPHQDRELWRIGLILLVERRAAAMDLRQFVHDISSVMAARKALRHQAYLERMENGARRKAEREPRYAPLIDIVASVRAMADSIQPTAAAQELLLRLETRRSAPVSAGQTLASVTSGRLDGADAGAGAHRTRHRPADTGALASSVPSAKAAQEPPSRLTEGLAEPGSFGQILARGMSDDLDGEGGGDTEPQPAKTRHLGTNRGAIASFAAPVNAAQELSSWGRGLSQPDDPGRKLAAGASGDLRGEDGADAGQSAEGPPHLQGNADAIASLLRALLPSQIGGSDESPLVLAAHGARPSAATADTGAATDRLDRSPDVDPLVHCLAVMGAPLGPHYQARLSLASALDAALERDAAATIAALRQEDRSALAASLVRYVPVANLRQLLDHLAPGLAVSMTNALSLADQPLHLSSRGRADRAWRAGLAVLLGSPQPIRGFDHFVSETKSELERQAEHFELGTNDAAGPAGEMLPPSGEDVTYDPGAFGPPLDIEQGISDPLFDLRYLVRYGMPPPGGAADDAMQADIDHALSCFPDAALSFILAAVHDPIARGHMTSLLSASLLHRIARLLLVEGNELALSFVADLIRGDGVAAHETIAVIYDSLFRQCISMRAIVRPYALSRQLLHDVAAKEKRPVETVLLQWRYAIARLVPPSPASLRILQALESRPTFHQPRQPPPSPYVSALPPEVSVNAKNAGLVLLAPYLGALFNRLELLEDGLFRSRLDQGTAIALLQYLACGVLQAAEYELVLHKILCGVDLNQPLPPMRELSDGAQKTCDSLLQAVTRSWTPLKNSSIATLRESFLQREGVLTRGDDFWTLRMVAMPYDMLLDSVPWSFRMIKSRWMTAALQVKWR